MSERVSDETLAEMLARVSPPADGWHAGLPTIDVHAALTELQSLRSAQASQAGEVEVVAWRWPHPLWPAVAFQYSSERPGGNIEPDPLVRLSSHAAVIAAKDAANAALMAERSNLIETKRQQLAAKDAEIERLNTLNANLVMQAKGHAQEARTANSTIYEIYQVLSGGKGEPGNWNGADPARRYVEAAEARANAAEAAIHLIQEEAEKDNSPLGRSDSLALERIRTVLSALNGAKP